MQEQRGCTVQQLSEPSYKMVRFRVTKDIYWEDWGRFVKVFRAGDVQTGRQYPDGSVSAESTLYDGISDGVDLDCIEIIEELEEAANE